MQDVVLELGLALSLTAVAGILSGRLRLSIVPFAILAGLVVGPHAPRFAIFDFRFIRSGSIIEVMGWLGVLFLMFFVGLEFSMGRLLRAGKVLLWSGVIHLLINFPLGLLVPWSLGWSLREALAVVGITINPSSAIITKLLVDLKRTANPETEVILGITLFEDLFVVLYLTLVSGLIGAGEASALQAAGRMVIALCFAAVVLLGGRRLVPVLNRWLAVPSDEVLLVSLFAGLSLTAALAERAHVSAAVGAFLVGLVVAETEHAGRIAQMVVPFRDFFGALFFFSFGLSIDPLALGGAVGPALAAAALTLVGSMAAGAAAGRMAGLSPRASTNIAFTTVPRGEFSIIVAALARAGGLRSALQPFTAVYVLVLALLGPLLTQSSARIYQAMSGAARRRAARARNR